jgi:hypothetical protein
MTGWRSRWRRPRAGARGAASWCLGERARGGGCWCGPPDARPAPRPQEDGAAGGDGRNEAEDAAGRGRPVVSGPGETPGRGSGRPAGPRWSGESVAASLGGRCTSAAAAGRAAATGVGALRVGRARAARAPEAAARRPPPTRIPVPAPAPRLAPPPRWDVDCPPNMVNVQDAEQLRAAIEAHNEAGRLVVVNFFSPECYACRSMQARSVFWRRRGRGPVVRAAGAGGGPGRTRRRPRRRPTAGQPPVLPPEAPLTNRTDPRKPRRSPSCARSRARRRGAPCS